MFTVNSIIKEVNELPQEKLDEVYAYVHSINNPSKKRKNQRRKILSFAGAFSDMSSSEYAGFIKNTSLTRKSLFDRKLDL